MGQAWKHGLGGIAVITGGALALMNVLGCVANFEDWRIQYGAAGVGLCADVGIVCLMLGFRDFRRKRRWFALALAVPLWLAASGYTIVQGAKWLEHEFETAQQPIKKQQLTEKQRDDKLKEENDLLREQNRTALHGENDKIRANASKLAAETRTRIKQLEEENTSAPSEVKPTPIKSPFAGYEQWITFILWLSSQACWFMAYGESEEAPEEGRAALGDAAGEMRHAPEEERAAPWTKSAAQPAARPRVRDAAPAASPTGEARQGSNVIELRPAAKPPLKEVLALKQASVSNREIARRCGVHESTIRRMLKSAAPAAQIAG